MDDMTMPAEAHPDVSTDPDLPTNLLYPSIRLLIHGDGSGKAHLPLQEHAYRIANEPNTFFYVLPHDVEDYKVAVFVRNFDSRAVSLVQRFKSLNEAGDMHCVCPANAEVCFEQPRRFSECGDGVDILNSETEELVMRLRFNGRPIPPDFVPYRREGAGWASTHGDPMSSVWPDHPAGARYEPHWSVTTDQGDLQGLLCRLRSLD
jgi:hypothetical protein